MRNTSFVSPISVQQGFLFDKDMTSVVKYRIRLALIRDTRSRVFSEVNREFKQSTTAGATTAAVTEKVWGEYVSVVC